MSKKHRISVDDKIKYVQEYLDGKNSVRHIACSIEILAKSFCQWILNYTTIEAGVFIMKVDKKYPKELKLQVVKDYLSRLWIHKMIFMQNIKYVQNKAITMDFNV